MHAESATSHAFLVVEDDAFAARTFVALIRAQAFARSVSTVKQALTAIDQRPWTGLLLDVTLPDGSGLDLLERLRGERNEVPVLVVTGSHDPTVANRAHRLGASCVFKPDVVADLRTFVHRAITATSDNQTRTLAAVRSLRRRLQLSGRELDVSENTVKTTVRRLLAKFKETSTEGVARAVFEEVLRMAAPPGP